MTADSLAAFLLRMYDEIAADAQRATAGDWQPGLHEPSRGDGLWSVNAGDVEVVSVGEADVGYRGDFTAVYGGCERKEDAAHIARHDPAYVLADIEAKRRIVEEHREVTFAQAVERGAGGCKCRGGWPCATLRALAQPFIDHPDFREEWRQ